MLEMFPLVGIFRGTGVVLPSLIRYEEELSLQVFPVPRSKQLHYMSKTWAQGSSYLESPMHTEIGIMKVLNLTEIRADIELMLSHPFGLTEIEAGTFENGLMEIRTTNISRTPTSKNNVVESVRRKIWINATGVRYEMFMKCVGEDEYLHLQAELAKI
jgi:hypothetical protein